MIVWLLADSEGCLISGNNKITLKLNKRSNSESLVRIRGEKNLESIFKLAKSSITRQKALLQREEEKQLEMLYLFWAEFLAKLPAYIRH